MHTFMSFDRDGKILSRKLLLIPVFTTPDNVGYHHLIELGEGEGEVEGEWGTNLSLSFQGPKAFVI